jgi:hypothetical protein
VPKLILWINFIFNNFFLDDLLQVSKTYELL